MRIEKNLQAVESFLVKNKNMEDIITTASGLQYEVVVFGDGSRLIESSRVSVHYMGEFISGMTFDNSVSRRALSIFSLNGVIADWFKVSLLSSPKAWLRRLWPN